MSWLDISVPQLQLGYCAASQCVADGTAHQLVNDRLLAKAHFRLRWVDVDVHAFRRNFQEQVDLGTSLAIRGDAVGIEDRMGNRAVFDDAAVDEDVLGAAGRTRFGKRRNEPKDAQPAHVAAYLDEILAIAVDLIDAIGQTADRRTLQRLAPGAREREAHVRIPESELGHQRRDLRRLRRIRLENVASRRKVVEEVGALDHGPLGAATRRDRFDRPAVDANLGAAVTTARARAQPEVRYGGDAWECLTAKSQGDD